MPPLLSQPRYKAKTKDTRRMNIPSYVIQPFSISPYVHIPRTLHIQRHERSCKPSIVEYAVRAHHGLRGRPTSVFHHYYACFVYHAYASSLTYFNLEISDLTRWLQCIAVPSVNVARATDSESLFRRVLTLRWANSSIRSLLRSIDERSNVWKNVSATAFALRGARVARVI